MRLAQDVEEIPLPADLPEVLAERFDMLPQQDKRVAYSGAVIGDSFATNLLSSVQTSLYGASDVQTPLESLVDREFLFQTSIGPELEFIFKHDVMRDLMISRQATSLRREQSKLVAAGIEDSCRDHLDEFQGILAMHWEMAGEMERAARSASFWGIYNANQQRNLEAQAAFENYDRLCEHFALSPLQEEQEADLLSSRIAVLDILGRYEDAIALCNALGDACGGRHKALALQTAAHLQRLVGDYDRSLSLVEKAMSLARENRDRETEGLSLTVKGNVYYFRADYDRALECYRQGESIFQELARRLGIAGVQNNMGAVFFELGDLDQALKYYAEALSTRRDIGARRGTAVSLHNIGELHQQRGDYDKALENYDQALSSFRALGDRSNIAMVLESIGTVQRLLGHWEEAMQYNQDALAIERELDNKHGIASVLASISHVRLDSGEFRKALEVATEANEIASDIGVSETLALSLSGLCRAHAGLCSWEKSSAFGNNALHLSDEKQLQEPKIVSRLAMAESHLQMARWYDEGRPGEAPPVARDDAIAQATEYANEAEQLAESKGMKGYAARAKELLAEIHGSS